MEAKILPVLVMLISLGIAAQSSESREYMLARDGKALVSIVVQEDADTRIMTAADDLQAYIKKMSGAEVPMITDGSPVNGPAIHVGRTEAVTNAGISFDVEREGYVIAPLENAIIICGANDYGTVHGVYGFLQDFMGIRWFRPGELWEVVPEADRLVVRVTETLSNPDYPYRIWSGLIGDDGRRWHMRSRLTQSNREIPYWGFGHNLSRIFPPSKYGDNPELYGEIRGKRVVSESDRVEGTQPCFTNPDVIRITIETAREFFDSNPQATQYSLCTNDNLDFCTCSECSKLDMPEMYSYHGWRTHSDSYYYYVEQVANEIAKSHPDKTLSCYAYWGVDTLPRYIKRLPDNVVIALTQDTSQHFDPEYRKHDVDLHLNWNKVANHIIKYDYYGLGWLTPRYFASQAADDLRFNHEVGINGIYIESYPFWAVTGPQLYMASRLLWDINQDPDALLDDYMTGLFEEAAPTMHEFYALMERIWTKERPGQWFQGLDWIDGEITNFDADAKAQGMNLLNKAYSESTGIARERVDDVRRYFRFSYLIASGYETAMSLQDLPIETPADADRFASEMRHSRRLVELAERTWASTLKEDPLHNFSYYVDGERFWRKFGGWQDYILSEQMRQLIRLQQWADAHLTDADVFIDGLIDDLQKAKITRRIDLRERLRPGLDIPRAGNIHIDGNPEDWAAASWIHVIDNAGDIMAEFSLAWDERYLYFACTVHDDKHSQRWNDENIWREDSLQIGLDILRDAWETRGLAPDDYEYGLALTPTGPLVWSWLDGAGKIDDAPVAIVHSDDTTFYEVSIPWTRLKPLQPIGGEIIGLSVLVNEFDGTERRFFEWGGGMATRKDPQMFMPVRLSTE